MIKKSVTYENFNGEEVTQVCYFHFSEPELVEMEVDYEGGLGAYIERMAETSNNKEIIEISKKLVLDSYGEKSDDGNRFIKNDEIREKFQSSIAYSKVFMEVATDETKSVEFIKGIMPKDLAEKLDKMETKDLADLQKARKEAGMIPQEIPQAPPEYNPPT